MSGIGERSIGAVLGDIASNVREMVRAELRLAKAEAGEQVSKAMRGAIFLAAGGGVGLVALAFVALAGVYLLATVVALWLAAVIVAVTAGVIAGVLIGVGLKQLQSVSLALPRTVATAKSVTTVREEAQWAKPSAR